MALTKYKLGELIKEIKEFNNITNHNFYGININKEFMPTIANVDDVNGDRYKLVKKNRFVFSGMQTGRDECIRISMYNHDDIIIVSPAYITFEIKRTDLIFAEYLFMLFLSKEKDRLGWFLSDSSIRANLDWSVFCDIQIELPDISIQQKYVNIYNSMVTNQKVYEKGLDDFKLVCDAYIENLRKDYKREKIGKYINSIDDKNTDLKIKLVQGVDVNMQFIPAKREAVDKKNANIVGIGQFAYNKVIKCNETKLPIAIRQQKECIVSSSYQVFDIIKKDKLLAEYLFLWLTRNETQRYCGFMSWGSTRDTFSYDELCKLEFPIPPLEIQKNIADVYSVYLKRKEINNKLKEKIKEICPVLIKGALDEGRKNV